MKWTKKMINTKYQIEVKLLAFTHCSNAIEWCVSAPSTNLNRARTREIYWKKSIGIYRRREICLIVHWKRAQHTRCLVWWGAVARAFNGNGTSHRQKDTPKYRSNASFKAIRYGERKAMMRENRKRNSVRNKETHGIIKRKEERIRREKKE